MKKPLSEYSHSRETPAENQRLICIADRALCALLGQIIAERNRYKKEVNLLQQHANIIIDRRPVKHPNQLSEHTAKRLSSLIDWLTYGF